MLTVNIINHGPPLQAVAIHYPLFGSRTLTAGLLPTGGGLTTLVELIGLDYETAASALRIPRGTVASRLNGARARLRTALLQGEEGRDG